MSQQPAAHHHDATAETVTGPEAGVGPRDIDPGIENPEVDSGTPSRGRVLIKGTLLQVLSQFVPLVVNIALTPFIMRELGPLWTVFLLISSIQVLMATVDGGIGPSASRYFSLYAGTDDKVSTTRLLTTLAAIVACTATVVFGIFFLLTPTILGWFEATRVDPAGSAFLLRTMVVLVAVNQVRGLFAYVLWANHRFEVTTAMTLLGYLVYVIGLVWSIREGMGLVGIAWMFVAQQMIATLFIVPSAARLLDRRGIGFVDRATLKDFFGYSWKAQLSSLLDVISQQGDMVIAQRFRPVQAGGFGPGANFAMQLRMVPLNAWSPIQAMVGRAVGADGPAGALASFERIQRTWVLAVCGWVAVGAPAAYFGVNAWLHRSMLEVAPGEVALPGIVAAVLLVGHLFWLLATIQVIWCLAVGRSDIELRFGIIAVVLNLTATIALIIPFGVVGSVIATAASQLVACVALGVIMRRRLQVCPPSSIALIAWVPTLAAAVLSLAGSWATSRLVPSVVPYGPFGLVVTGLGAAPALVVYALWTLGPGQIRDLVAARFPRFARA